MNGRLDTMAAALRDLLAHPGEQAYITVARAELHAYDEMREVVRNARKKIESDRNPVKIEDHQFVSKVAAYHVAQAQGFDGSQATFLYRINKGLSWEECIKPVDLAKSQARKRTAIDKREQLQRELRGELPLPRSQK